jgi:hypothetical protein
MSDIIKTWPANVRPQIVAKIFSFNAPWTHFYYTLGRGKPTRPLERIWFTYQGRILGSFNILEVVQNDGSLPKLQRLDGGESDWQIRKDYWVAICNGFTKAPDRRFMSGFRGFRYFDWEEYTATPDSRMRI